MASSAVNSFANLYQLDAMKVAYYASHSVLTLVSPALLYRWVELLIAELVLFDL